MAETITLDRETFESAMLRLTTRKSSRDHATAMLRLTTRNSFGRDHATAALFRAATLPDPPDAFDRAVKLFDQYRDYFSMDEKEDLQKQYEYEEEFCELVCDIKGHDIGPNHCGKPEHDYCYRCGRTAGYLGYRRGEDGRWVKK